MLTVQISRTRDVWVSDQRSCEELSVKRLEVGSERLPLPTGPQADSAKNAAESVTNSRGSVGEIQGKESVGEIQGKGSDGEIQGKGSVGEIQGKGGRAAGRAFRVLED